MPHGHGRVIYHDPTTKPATQLRGGGPGCLFGTHLVVAVNGAPLIGETRRYAEARTHFAAGVTLLGPGVPMFFMGEEVGASEPYRYNDFLDNREDFPALRRGTGGRLFRF